MLMFVIMMVLMIVVMLMIVARALLGVALIFSVLTDYQIHPALGAAARPVPDDLRVHGTGIFGPGIFLCMVVLVIVAALRGRFPGFARYQVHAAFGATARLVFNDLRVHGADILDSGMQNIGVKILRRFRKGTVDKCAL